MRMDLTGEWWGTYYYPDHAGPVTPFNARIQDSGGHIRGVIMELDQLGGGAVLNAIIIGYRHDLHVDFIKTYDAEAPEEYGNPVDYVGSLSPDGSSIIGVWSLLEFDGRFEMYREIGAAEKIEETISATVDF